MKYVLHTDDIFCFVNQAECVSSNIFFKAFLSTHCKLYRTPNILPAGALDPLAVVKDFSHFELELVFPALTVSDTSIKCSPINITLIAPHIVPIVTRCNVE